MNAATTLVKLRASGRRDDAHSRSLGICLIDGLVSSVMEHDLLDGIGTTGQALVTTVNH